MGDFNPMSDLPQASREGKPKPIKSDAEENSSQLMGVVSRRNSLAKLILRESQTCTKRVAQGRVDSHSPPVNFAMVCEGLYRSGYPQAQDYPFMQSLKLKTIVTLVRKDLPDGYQEFITVNGITHKIFDMAGTKKEEIPVEMMRAIHAVVSESENYPLLIHCNHGKHRTGCVVGVFRKSNQWDLKRVIDEYSSFAEPKVRETDLRYLTEFELAGLWRQPQEVALRATTGRFVRLVIAVVLILVLFYPLTNLRVRPESS
ncbi:tyrosine phosphatase family-domain-containing protein [Nemania serpens]|nr:tyrosine phosphatase family-domain-containing protein [Nemania serpens]